MASTLEAPLVMEDCVCMWARQRGYDVQVDETTQVGNEFRGGKGESKNSLPPAHARTHARTAKIVSACKANL